MENDLIKQIFEVCVIPLMAVLTTFIVKYLNVKINSIISNRQNDIEKKYLLMLNEIISNCVIATNQTYVDSLKQSGSFDAEAQKKAFDDTFKSVSQILTDDAKKVLTEAVGDLNLYINQRIEAEVKITKEI